jgi:hypothetical protein
LLAIGFDLFVAQSPVSIVPPYSAPWLALVEIQTFLVTTLALAWFRASTGDLSRPVGGMPDSGSSYLHGNLRGQNPRCGIGDQHVVLDANAAKTGHPFDQAPVDEVSTERF